MTALVLALRGAAAVAVLTSLAGGLPPIVRVGLAAVFGLWAMIAAGVAVPDDVTWLIAARELVIGATLGIVAVVPFVAARFAGALVDRVNAQARLVGAHGPYGALFGVLAAAVFVGIDGHVAFVTAIADSFAAVPAIAETQPRVLDALGALIGAGVRLAVPWLVTALVVELAVGVGARVAGRTGLHAPVAAAVPAALAMMTAALISTLAIAMAALIRAG
jgi:flagellar biosynthesis protein FliR